MTSDKQRDYPATRRSKHVEDELLPGFGGWRDLVPPNAGTGCRFILACLEHGALEAWQDGDDNVRLYLPTAFGGDLVLPAPADGAPPLDLKATNPYAHDPDALVQRVGAMWLTLLPGIRRTRRRGRITNRSKQEAGARA